MGSIRPFAGVATILATVAVLTSCTSDPVAPSSTKASTGATTTGPASTTVVSTSLSAEDKAIKDARAVLGAYFRAIPACLSDPVSAPPTCFDDVAITTELTNMRNALTSAKTMKTKTTGSIEVLSAAVKSVSLASNVAATPPTVPEVVLLVCADVSKLNIVDSAGKSIVPPDRKPHELAEFSVLNYQYPDQAKWRVGQFTPIKDRTC